MSLMIQFIIILKIKYIKYLTHIWKIWISQRCC